ncbi:hypothetical protein [Reichenbachiella ulvae]|uniref:Activator of Hsp90 ATPase homolog 1-like protein n=1 Tax=Reichenbachiella ulvae TaxID=2980104 RepID=A0ABT3CTU8_9BACT|nr:hypothetical protein [Reichenbachiella ulvae]MCV9386949.1 hypothetical protein [Reichenbachiella ulvae]
MAFQDVPNQIHWKLHFSSTVDKVYQALNTDEGRSGFWAETAPEIDGHVHFSILNYPTYEAKIIDRKENEYFKIEYFGTEVTFTLRESRQGGTILNMFAFVTNTEAKEEMTAGWVSVLLAMKASVDFGVDLRNHSEIRSWQQGFVDN